MLQRKNFFSVGLALLFLAALWLGQPTAVLAQPSTPMTNWPTTNNTVYAIVPDGSGGVYIGGDFTQLTPGGGGAAVTRNRLAHINADGTIDATWNPNVTGGAVRALTLDSANNRLYVGGAFTTVGGTARNRIALVSTSGAGAVDATWNPNVTGTTVYVMLLSSGNLYVGGAFTNIGGQARNNLARVSATGTGAADTWNPNVTGTTVQALELSGTTLYIAGNFTAVGGTTRRGAAAVLTTDGSLVAWNPTTTPNGRAVFALAPNAAFTTIYAGGDFNGIGGKNYHAVAALDTSGSAVNNWDPGLPPSAVVNALALSADGNTLYLGGSFTTIDGTTVRNYLAAVPATGTGTPPTAWDPNANGTVYALAQSGGTVYVGGAFTTIGGNSQLYFAAFGPQAPTATTNAASGVSANAATLNGTVNPNGASTNAWFEYGLTTGYGSSTTSQSVGSGYTVQAVNDSISGLLPGRTYHFRVVANNGLGGDASHNVYGADQTFTTSAAAPTATTNAASGVSANAATLNGTVDPNGSSTNIWFQWGTTTSYGNTTTQQNIGNAGGGQAVSANISGLLPGRTYHFRVVANNGIGGDASHNVYGADQTFTTSAAAPTATTNAASAVTANAATLNGTVDPNGASTNIWFQWGTTTGYGNTTTSQNIGSAGGAQAVNANISGLLPGTTYHFRVVANNGIGGDIYGSDQQFTTAALAPSATTNAASGVTANGATLNGTVNPNGANTTVWFEWGTTTSYGNTDPDPALNIGATPSDQSVNTTLSGLLPGTTYHYRVVAQNSVDTTNGADQTFTTSAAAPSATTNAASAVTDSSATLNGLVNPNGATTNIWFEWGTTTSYGNTTTSQNIGSTTGDQAVSANISGLTMGTLYHFRVVANNGIGGNIYGADRTFSASANAPTVTTDAATSVAAHTATVNGTANPKGADTDVWFEYGTTTGYGSSTAYQNIGSGVADVSFNAGLTGLAAGTTYHYRAVAQNSVATSYGDDATFITTDVPDATTNAATAVTANAATLNGAVNPNGADTNAWFQWGTTTSYGTSTTPQNVGADRTDHAVNAGISGLLPGTTYHFRVVGQNSVGTTYGSDQTLTTAALAPSATTDAASGVDDDDATLNGTVNPNGASTSTWFEWGTTTSYGNSTTHQDIGAAPGNQAINAALSGLLPGTTYHYRVVAENSVATTNGTDQTFTTDATAPGVTTQPAGTIMSNSATLNATVNPNGDSTTVYFDWGLTTGYGNTAPSPAADIGSTTGDQLFSTGLTGLLPGTTYHFRVVATNGEGTTYGPDQTFTTDPTAPGATTNPASNITASGARLNGTANPNGATTTAWFEYGTTTSYGSSTTSTDIGSVTGDQTFDEIIGGLLPGTTYHFRMVTQNSEGTTEGADQTFTTDAIAPGATTGSATDVEDTTAMLNGTANPNGAATTVWFQYGTTTSYGSETTHNSIGAVTGNQAVSAGLTGLTPGMTYHFRLVAQNSEGTTYGEDGSFTASATAPVVASASASNILQDSVVLNATVDPKGLSTSVVFRWGTTSGHYPNTITAVQSPLSGTGNQATNAALTSLSPNTTYYFIAVATNTSGTATSSEAQFTTLPLPPSLFLENATDIRATTVTFNTTVNPNGGTATVNILLSTNADLSGATTIPLATGLTANTNQTLSKILTGMSPDTIYYYTVQAVNSGGTTTTGIASFSTGFPAATGDIVGLSVDNGALQNIQALTQEELPQGCISALSKVVLARRAKWLYGFFTFDITGITSGSTAQVALDVAQPTSNLLVFKCSQYAPGLWEWREITTDVDVLRTGTQVQYNLQDAVGLAHGQRDSNGAGGTIHDPVGLVEVPVPPIPTLTEWGLLAFVGILGGYAAQRLRRRK